MATLVQPREPSTAISAEEAQAAATDYLLDHVGNQLIAGQPHLMTSLLHEVWIVPVHLSYLPTGLLGSVGVVAIDSETGKAIAWTPVEQMKAASRALCEMAEPQLASQFQSFMASAQPS